MEGPQEPRGPNELAAIAKVTLAELLAERERTGATLPKRERKRLNARIKMVRGMLNFARSRVGYTGKRTKRRPGHL